MLSTVRPFGRSGVFTSMKDVEVAGVRVSFYEANDSVFLDHRYLIRGVAGRVLWLLLTLHEADGRTTFYNRELRLHSWLELPRFKDNLETRLLALQRRLDAMDAPIRVVREERGRVELAFHGRPTLERIVA